MPTEDRSSAPLLGAALSAAREAAGLSVEKLASETKIRATLIRDLETDQFSSSGGTVYARGHVKSIASSLHVDPAPLLAMFDAEAGGAPPAMPLAQAEALPVAPTSFGGSDFAISKAASLRPERTGPRWGIALAGAAVVLGGLVVIGSLSGGGSSKPPTTLGAPPATTPAVQVTASPTPPPLTAQKPIVTGAQLRVRVIGGASWVSISNATATLFEGILQDGQFKDFHDAAKLKVVVGFAPAVNLNCGGHDSGQAATTAKRVKTFYCTSTGLTSL